MVMKEPTNAVWKPSPSMISRNSAFRKSIFVPLSPPQIWVVCQLIWSGLYIIAWVVPYVPNRLRLFYNLFPFHQVRLRIWDLLCRVCNLKADATIMFTIVALTTALEWLWTSSGQALDGLWNLEMAGTMPAEFENHACSQTTPSTIFKTSMANPSPHVPSEESARGHVPTKKRGRRSGGKPTATPTPKGPSVSWDADPTCTDKLVSWMVSHSGDHNILFHDCLSNSTPLVLSPDDKPSGKNKKEVTTAITKHIFEHDLVYASLYAVDPGKFAMSVTNRLGMLKSKCCEQHAWFSSTGSGVMPDGSTAPNLLGENDAAEEDGITSDIPVCCNESMDFMMNDPEIPEGLGNNYGVDGAMNEDHMMGWRAHQIQLAMCASVKPSSQGSTTSSTKKVSSTIAKKLEDLDKESDMYHGELEDSQTRCAALQYNYAIWDKELELQWEELNSKCANAEIEFRWEQDLKKLEIELKKAEESAFSQQIELVQPQITLKVLEQAPSSSTAASGKIPTSAGPSSG
ncbi:hypothetical protein F5141DRAFT_1070328 [Pisolithus sp. B1]|nr:hypothetical protein F5141DRAFT_1070328 [Pisolithus sp. B1]